MSSTEISLEGARRLAGSLLVLLGTALPTAACAGSTSISESQQTPSASSGSAYVFQAHDWFAVGPHGVGNIDCNLSEIVWTTGTQSISVSTRSDVVDLSQQADAQPQVVASARHGGDLTSSVALVGLWLVYLEYQQRGQADFANFWYLNAVNWSTGTVLTLAQATTGLGLTELPWYDAADGRAVWNQLDAGGNEALHVFDFSTGQSSTLNLPPAMSPFEPSISGSSVVFVDNSTDPNRASENFFGRRGSLRRYDLATGQVSTLDAEPTAFMPHMDNAEVVWNVVNSSGNSNTVAATPQVGGKVIRFTGNGYPVNPETNGAFAIWYDAATLHFMALGVKTGRVVQLKIGDWADIRSVFALCGTQLYFALPPALDGGTSTIRRVDLSSLAV